MCICDYPVLKDCLKSKIKAGMVVVDRLGNKGVIKTIWVRSKDEHPLSIDIQWLDGTFTKELEMESHKVSIVLHDNTKITAAKS